MSEVTQIVTLPEERLEELGQWLETRKGATADQNLVLGKFGYLYKDGVQPSLNDEVRMIVALMRPSMKINGLRDLAPEITEELLQLAADSCEWMNEGHFNGLEGEEIMRILRPALERRGRVTLSKAEAKINHLREATGLEKLPD